MSATVTISPMAVVSPTCSTTSSSSSSSSTTCSAALSSSGASSYSCTRTTTTQAQYAFKMPSLDDIINGSAPHPYTLDAFRAFLSRNHCQEVLEFALDCKNYRSSYYGWHNDGANGGGDLNHAWCSTSMMLHAEWNKMMTDYIKPDSAKEINILCSVREALLSIDTTQMKEPVHPTNLEQALQQAKDLMKENALLQFVTACKCSQRRTADDSALCTKSAAARSSSMEDIKPFGQRNRSATSISSLPKHYHSYHHSAHSHHHAKHDSMCYSYQPGQANNASDLSRSMSCANNAKEAHRWKRVSQRLPKWLNVAKVANDKD